MTDYWKEHIAESSGGNISYIAHIGKNILIGNQFTSFQPKQFFFNTTEKEIIKILDKWGKLLKERPQEIIFFQDKDGKAWLEGRDKETSMWTLNISQRMLL